MRRVEYDAAVRAMREAAVGHVMISRHTDAAGHPCEWATLDAPLCDAALDLARAIGDWYPRLTIPRGRGVTVLHLMVTRLLDDDEIAAEGGRAA